MQAVSEVKKTEIDLDRATVQCNDLNKMIIFEKDQQKVWKLKNSISEKPFNLEFLEKLTKKLHFLNWKLILDH